MSEPRSKSGWTKSALVLLIVLGAAFVLLIPILNAGFLTDDYVALRHVSDDLELSGGLSSANLKSLAAPYVRQVHQGFQLYRPNVLLSFGLNLLTSGPNPRAFLLVNLLLHLLCGVLLFILLRQVLSGVLAATAGGAVLWFLISPLQVEAVAWSAARSETLSLAFGLLALITALRWPRSRIVPAIFCLLALTSKESALLFPIAIVLLDGFDPSGQVVVCKDMKSRLPRLAPILAVVAFWFAARWIIFGTPMGGSYNNLSFSEYFSDPVSLGGRYVRSLARVFAPISSIAFAASPASKVLAWSLAAGTGGIVFGGVIVGLTRRRRVLVLALVLVALPLALGVLVNEIGSGLVNSRAAYSTMAGLALLAAMGTELLPRGLVRSLPLVLAIVASAFAVRPTIAPWVEAHAQLEARLDSVREPLIGRDIDTVVLTRYREARYFRDSFDMAVGIRYALGRPFMERNLNLYKVGCKPDVVDPSSLGHATFGDAKRVAVFSPRKKGSDEFQLLYGGERRTASASITLLEPAPDALVEVGRDSPGLHFTCDVTGAAGERFFLHVLTDNGRLGVLEADPLTSPEGAGPVRRTFTLGVLDDAVFESLKKATPFLWFVTAGPNRETSVLSSSLRRVLVERPTR